MSFNHTPSANRLHIGIFGKRNAGKSSLMNALTDQTTALVSSISGTTTDPIYKTMEINGLGPCVFIDTAGFDDGGELGLQRVEKTKQVIDKTDMALLLFTSADIQKELTWLHLLKQKEIPVIAILNKSDCLGDITNIKGIIEKQTGLPLVIISAQNKSGIQGVITELIRNLPKDYESSSLMDGIVKKRDIVLLVMPQDAGAPKGRLILPQVQTIRDLLDHQCITISCTTDDMKSALGMLKEPPALIIADSQVFHTVYEMKPETSHLISFSILFARYKGDLDYFLKSVEIIPSLTEDSRILIAEACTHAPLSEDIGRIKIPELLRKKIGNKLKIEIVSGSDFPEDLSVYDFIIHCGACMFNRKLVISRVQAAQKLDIPMSNYGVVIAYLNGILSKLSL